MTFHDNYVGSHFLGEGSIDNLVPIMAIEKPCPRAWLEDLWIVGDTVGSEVDELALEQL